MITIARIPRTTAPPTAAPMTAPLLFPFALASLSPGPSIAAAELDAAFVARDD